MGGPEGFDTLRTLASLLGGQIACSRACVEAGWIDASPQVGQTGKTVRPELYLACGISGAFQHVTGMEESQLIIAINKKPGRSNLRYLRSGNRGERRSAAAQAHCRA